MLCSNASLSSIELSADGWTVSKDAAEAFAAMAKKKTHTQSVGKTFLTGIDDHVSIKLLADAHLSNSTLTVFRLKPSPNQRKLIDSEKTDIVQLESKVLRSNFSLERFQLWGRSLDDTRGIDHLHLLHCN